ncbi:MAG: RNA-binding S4 domain-containing protein [Rhodospirillales bacterium]|nr:MAG: RNA-binding S4 domain-containing protein [Rhodospirillales bacterium]
MDGPATLRLDKWLWHARFFKSRALATKAVERAPFRVDGRRVDKAHALVAPGMVVTFALGPRVRVVRVLALGVRRGPAPEARALYEDLSDGATAA